ncbi:MAG: penicillin-binding protein 2 [Erythrobacter sp.]|jgi:cell division protein FtsI (penicillin-binding protein 3)|nr:penicillin-binding protein 2 [Erythrobacter sp.]
MNAFSPGLGRPIGAVSNARTARRTALGDPAQPSLFDPAPFAPTKEAPASRRSPDPRPGATARPTPPRPMGRARMVHLRYRLLLDAQFRAYWLILAFAALTMIALTRIAWLGFDADGAGGARIGATTLVPGRGEITDRNGAILARDYPQAYALWFNPAAMKDDGLPLTRPADEVAARLKAVIPELDEGEVREILATGKRTYLARRILPEQANRVHAIGEIALETPQEIERHYPQGRLAAHVLGRMGEIADGPEKGRPIGEFGMERALDDHLTGELTRAEPVALSIDVRVQGALEDAMEPWRLRARAKGAAGVVLDVETGEILALASLPDFNPNRRSAQDEPNVLNRVTNMSVELGSTFKPITVAAAIDAGVITDLRASWNSTPMRVQGFTIRDFTDKGERLNIPQALAYSSNTVTARVAEELGPGRLRAVMMELGMNKPLPIEMPSRGHPIWPRGRWDRVRTMTVGYGHGIGVTPLHLASAYAAMVNGGIWRAPTLLKRGAHEIAKGRRVFKASTSSRMRQLLRMVTIYGTGRNADAKGYRVGGKTGSAEKWIGNRYAKDKIISSFAAAFPMDRPRYVVVVALDEPKAVNFIAARTAASNAAPIVGELVPRIAPLLGVRPDEARDVDISDLQSLMEKKP